MGTGLSCLLVVSTKWRNISIVSRGRNRRTIGYKHSKNGKNITRRTASDVWRIFAQCLNMPINRQAIEDELNIDGGKYVLACFKIWELF